MYLESFKKCQLLLLVFFCSILLLVFFMNIECEMAEEEIGIWGKSL